ncbi:MAG: helix-hairpin-helix domain-containing protein [Chitinophagaceae bacterium]
MSLTVTRQAEELLRDSLKELESSKGSVVASVQKLSRAAKMLGDNDVVIWCEIQLGVSKYTQPLGRHLEKLREAAKANTIIQASKALEVKRKNAPAKKSASKKAAIKKSTSVKYEKEEKALDDYWEHQKALETLGLKKDVHFTIEELNVKLNESGGGYLNIGTIEEIYTNLIRKKRGNDGTYYQNHLASHISYVKRVAHDKASQLYNRVTFANTPQTSLDILRDAVDNKLLDLAPTAAEKLMIAFKAVASDSPEEWSHALTTCRRFIEELADALYPARSEQVKGRELGKGQYVNRLWAFMDGVIESESNRDLAKAHVDYLGSYLQRTHKVSNKGVHADLTRMEAVKAVFHAYLVAADILDYLNSDPTAKDKRLNIHTASIDELESILDISRNLAKAIVRLRVEHGVLDLPRLATIKGMGQKTLALAEQVLSFEPAK